MSYIDLNEDNIKAYVKSKVDFFAPDAVLNVYTFGDGEDDGDGFINYVYRVWEEGGASVIVKQAKTRTRVFGEGVGPFVQERNALEAEHMQILYGITPEYIPEVYVIDRENHTYICEDCSDLKIIRFEMMKGKVYKNAGQRIGEFIAKSNFYTSEIFLTPEMHQELQAKYINPQQRKIFQCALFLKDESAFDNLERPAPDPIRAAMGDAPWESKAFRTEMLKLRHIHMKKGECLVHGDLHTSNILLNDDRMKIIDMEYSYMGPLSGDMGYLIGNTLYEYFRWLYLPDHDDAFRTAMCAYSLQLSKDIIDSYLTTYKQCWQESARFTYQGYDEYCDYICETWFNEMVGFIGCQMISRVGGCVPLPDLDDLPKDAHYEACRIVIMLGYYLIMHRGEINTSDELIDLVVDFTHHMRKHLKY